MLRTFRRILGPSLKPPTPVPSEAPSRAMHAASASSAHAEVLHEYQGGLRAAVLNRPRALNALSASMIETLYQTYRAWDAAPGVGVIVVKGAGERAFCAGGDVKAVVQAGRAGNVHGALRFFRSEYRLNHLISSLTKPYVALMDGITMGGGAGVAIHGTFRVATERTVFAMPECAIGLFPDVGASHFLSRLPGGLGLYLGLTGARLNGVDVRHAGLATHYLPSALLPSLQAALAALGSATCEPAVRRVLHEFEGRAALPEGELPARMQAIEAAFSGKGSVEDVYRACEGAGRWGADTLALMSKGSPTSQLLTFEQLRRGAGMPLDECLRMEYRMVYRLVADPASDFYAGVDAVLIKRSGTPLWLHSELGAVPAAAVQRFFELIPVEEELQLASAAAAAQRHKL